MSGDRIGSISDVIADAIRSTRQRDGLSRGELADAAREAGAPSTFTGTALGNIETGRRDAGGRRRREVTVEELVALATAAKVSPLVLLGEYASAFGVQLVEECQRCAGRRGDVEAVVRADIEGLGQLEGLEASLAETAYALAEGIDTGGGEDGKQLPSLAKELRATLKELAALRSRQPAAPGEDDLDDLGAPD